ncbi:DegT/DnrJ/EryC1/StrS family aminotransferase [Sphingomicrobium sediminis]|uniref:DegT/DnrJ/EryC1/StrS aminotransferase family protein n=1 Tax=Sphingomicrobium sediminis TaxID=2950949 RepID=A0A9X2EFL7_9SPHN|nr:DegT/DnrJ/EryC1/StrS aminotransferase family protein [Sphingomicrobium sediminis]MCM8556642.1 DegT/DnrJ/EryC1/StrS aminotransferase family protein [Sphingomicrobium sediminis]
MTDFAPWPSFTAEEADAVQRVLLSNKVNYWTGGEGKGFEEEFAAYADSAHAIALGNGTLALDLALHGLGIGARNGGSETDEVVVTPRSFIASVSAVVNAGARPVFADVDRESGNIEAHTVEPVLSERTRAIILVHLAGWPVDMAAMNALAAPRGIAVIEDCAQAHGARFEGKSVGSLGVMGCWSFCQDKIMTTGGEGGMLTTSDETLWRRMWAYKDHGKSYAAVFEREHPSGFRWLHESFGTNFRLTEMQSAIGRIQLARMEEWTARRRQHAMRMRDMLGEFANAVRTPWPDESSGSRHAAYKYYAYVQPDGLANGWDRDRIVAEINAHGIPCFQGSCSEIYREKAFEGSGFVPAQPLATARELGETSIMWLVHPTITDNQMDRAIDVTRTVIKEATA